jgi:hypothetical protein
MEKLEIEGVAFHKACFKCETCKGRITPSTYASLQGKFYCKPHLKQLFQLKGNYDEGFGRDQRKSDWNKKDTGSKVTPVKQTPAPAPVTPAPVDDPVDTQDDVPADDVTEDTKENGEEENDDE